MGAQRAGTEPVSMTVEEALAMLPEGDTVHTFRNPGGMLVGADWSRSEIISAIQQAEHRQLAGGMATRMGHGLVIDHEGKVLFVETKEPTHE